MKNKKGELTTTQLVTLIVLIVSFIIILFLIFRLNLGKTTDAEICKNSVVLKGQSSLPSGPINCKIGYLCISGGQDCQDFSASEKISVDSTKTQIMTALANSMSNCWFEFGEGKINYGTSTTNNVYYAICSIISFDKTIQDKTSQISYQEFYTFLQQTKKDDTQTYLHYLYGINDVSQFSSQPQVQISLSQDRILTNGKYSVVTGIANSYVGIISSKSDAFLKVYIIPTSETSSRLQSGGEFITKA